MIKKYLLLGAQKTVERSSVLMVFALVFVSVRYHTTPLRVITTFAAVLGTWLLMTLAVGRLIAAFETHPEWRERMYDCNSTYGAAGPFIFWGYVLKRVVRPYVEPPS